MGLGDLLLPERKIREMEVKKDVGGLIQFLDSNSVKIRLSSINALSNIGDKRAVEPLIDCTYAREPIIRGSAAATLGKIGDPRAIPALLALLNDKEYVVVAEVDSAIQSIGWSACYKLIEALGDCDESIVAGATKHLSQFYPQSVEPLINSLSYIPNVKVRANIILILGELKDVRALEPITRALNDEAIEVRNAAAIAIKGFNITAFTKEKETIKEIVKIPCKYCSSLIENTSTRCPVCGAPLTNF